MVLEPDRCPFCQETIRPSLRGLNHVVYLRGTTGVLIIADVEHLLHKCKSLTRSEEIELLRDANLLFGNDLDEP